MATLYLSSGETAEVENVRGHDPRTFTVALESYNIVARAFTAQVTAKFSPDGEIYLLKQLRGYEGTAVLQTKRAR